MAAPWSAGARVRIIGSLHGQVTNNVLHFATNTVVSDPTSANPLLQALIAAVVECVILALPGITQDWLFERVEGQFIYHGGAGAIGTDPLVETPPANTFGTSGVCSHSFAATLINLRSGLGGRSGRGKMFLPPCGEAQTTNSRITASTVEDALVAFLECMADKFGIPGGTTDWKWGVLSRKIAGATNADFNNGFFTITLASPNLVVAALTRRKIGHGR